MKVWTNLVACVTVVVALALMAGLAAAGSYDGSRSFLCAVTTIMECDSSGQCERQISDDANSPKFIRVDVAGKTITDGANKLSVLKSVTHLDGELILQGGENGRGWSATIDEETGSMAVAVVDNNYTFSLFGACILP